MREMQEAFAREYPIDFNGTQAAIRAGYAKSGASVQAVRLLKMPHVIARIKNLIEERHGRTNTKADDALRMISDVAEADPNALVEMRRGSCRYCNGQGGFYQYTKQEWIKVQEDYAESKRQYELRASDDAKPFPPLDVKGGIGYNPNNAINPNCTECFGEGIVRTYINDTRNLPAAARRLFGGIKETSTGIELKVNSQDKARELLAKHHGLLIDRIGNPDGSNINPVPAPMIVKFKSPKKDAA